MNKWELANYFIEAKKNIDSLIYIFNNEKSLANINLKEKEKSIKTNFYLNCCYVLDEEIKHNNLNKKTDSIIESIYYERDKYYAHKDSNYEKTSFSLEKQIKVMKNQLEHIKEVCTCLPKIITIDYISHDKELFRIIHRIDAETENEIKKKKHPFYEQRKYKNYGIKEFEDIEDIKDIQEEDKNKYGVMFDSGICFNEWIQNMQDASIKTNVLFNENMWTALNKEEYNNIIELTKLGCFDEYGIIQAPPTDPIIQNRINTILNKMERKEN